MGKNSYRSSDNHQMETRKVVRLVCLMFFSVLIIQYLDLPYASLLYSGKAYFSFHGGGGGGDRVTGRQENPSQLRRRNSSLSVVLSVNPPMPVEDDCNNTSSYNVSEETAADKSLTGLELGSPTPASPDSVTAASSSTDSTDHSRTSAESLSDSDRPPAEIEIKSDDVVANGSLPTVAADFYDHVVAEATAASPPSPAPVEVSDGPVAPSVVSISEMNDMLARSHALHLTKSPLWSLSSDQELLDARFQIKHAPILNNHPNLHASIYRNLSMFVRSYEIMEQKLKVYIYKDGESPVFDKPKLTGIYASEGWFMKHMKASNRFLTMNPQQAHLFYLPFSSQSLVDHVYVPDSHRFDDIITYLKNYLDMIQGKYPFWNRTNGADHFLVACHDWAPIETRRHMSNCIRALCNADVKEGFQFGKDVSLPETYIHSPHKPMRSIGGKPPLARTTLAFFAGQMHGDLRPSLLKHWENKGPNMKIFGKLRKKSYATYMKSSKYCICAKGYEVNSPRVVESIIYGCVPVIISDNFVPPFFDVLNWDSLAVFVPEKKVPDLDKILESISEERYLVMYRRVEQVRQHFVWHNKAVKYDIFHMILHSIWYNRVMRLSPG